MSFFDRLPTKRRCGECDLCCTALWVHELDKPPETPCKHLCGDAGSSCSIYKDRPRVCREYACMWRASDTMVPQSMWPAKCGFLISIGNITQFPLVITVGWNPDHPDSWNKPQHHREFFRLAALFNAIVVIGDDQCAHMIFSPRGHTFSKADYPMLFKEDGNVGLPDFEFLPHRPTPHEIAAILFS